MPLARPAVLTLFKNFSACVSAKLQLAGVLAEVNDDLERAVRSLTVADLKATACRGAAGVCDRSHAGGRAAKSATEAC
jgi:hypothetical protein